MENLNKFYNYLKKEEIKVEELKNYLKKKFVRVNTIISKNWQSKPYICYNDYCNEWFLFLKSKDTRRIKKLMKLAKERIRLEMPEVTCKFVVESYERYLGVSNES